MARRPRVLLMVETSLAFGRSVLKGVSQYLVAHGPWSLYLDLRELLIAAPDWLETWDGEGIISRATTPELAAQLNRRGIPTIDLTDIRGDLGLHHIWVDHQAVGKLAAAHLLERGFRQFAFCGYSDHDWSRKRQEGFLGAIEDLGTPVAIHNSPWDTSRGSRWEQQQHEIARWLKELPRPLGVMACNDLRGHQVLEACRRSGISVPEEVAVIGVDDDELLCGLCDPPLSSIVPNAEKIGYEAAAMLDRLMQGQKTRERILTVEPLGVVTRQSTDVLAINDQLVAAAVRFIREHACEGITVEDILHSVPLSRSVLEKRFRKYVGRSPQSEIRNVQLKRVRQLLAETDMTLENIAQRTGYAHTEYMSVVFKRETGQTPGQYRRASQPGTSEE